MPTFAAAIAPRFVRKRRSSAVPSAVEAGVIAILKHFEKLYTHMPLFTPYFSLDSSAYRVGNGGRLRCHMGAAGIGIYVMLLSHLRDCRDYRAPLDYDLLAFDLHEDADAVRRVVEEFDLFDIDRASGTFTSSALDAVRALGTSDSPSSGRTSTRTGRVRRVRTAAQAYRRSVRRLAADNALPSDAEEDLSDETDSAPAKELGTPPADCATAENDFTTAEEGNAPLAEIDSTPAEEEETSPADAPRSAAEPAPTANENAPSPRTEEKRGEQNKIPHTPIVPFPPSGKGTRASHSSAPVVEEEEGASVAEVEGAVPTVADTPFTPAEEEPKTTPADSPTAEIESAHPDARTPHGETDTTQATTSPDAHGTRTPRGETDTTPATTAAAHPDARTPHGETNATQATTSADDPDTEALNPEPTDDASHADDEDGGTFVPPTANEVRRFAQALHHPEFDAEWFVHYYTARHWQRHNGHPVRSWQTTARYWLTHPLQVAQHLLRHRPDPGAAPAGTSPSPAGTSASPAGIISTTGSTSPSSPGPGAAPAGTHPSSPASGVPLGGSLSLPAPTPLQQSRLCDLRHMVHHLFADAPGAAPAAVSTVPDAPAATSTPASSASTSAPSPRILSPAEAAHFIEAQTLSAADAEEDAPACELSTTDTEEDELNGDERPADGEENTDTQAFSTDKAEEGNRTHELSTADDGEDELNGDELESDGEESFDAQALSTDPTEEENRAHELSTADTEEGELNGDELDSDGGKDTDTLASFTADNEEDELHCDELATDAKEGIEAQALSTDPAKEEARACKISTTDAEEDKLNGDELDSNSGESTDAQAFPTARHEEENRACELSTTDNEEDALNGDERPTDAKESIEKQAFPTDHSEEEAPACKISTADGEKGELHCDELDSDGEENTDAQVFATDKAEEENRACEISTGDDEKDELNGDEHPTDAEESFDAQALSTTDTEEENRACEISTADNGKGIDTQAFSTTNIEEDARTCESDAADIGGGDCNCDELLTDIEKNTDTQAISTTKERFGVHSPHGPAPPTGGAHSPSAALHRPHSHTTEKHPFTLNLNHDAPPILPLHPPTPVGLGCTLRVQSAQPPFGRSLLGRIDLGSAPCPAGSRPLRPQPAEDRHNLAEYRRGNPDHVPFGGVHEPERHSDEYPNRDFAAKRHPDTPLGSVHEPKTADFIDNSTADDPQRRPDTGEHPADEPQRRSDAPEHPTDKPEHRTDAGKHPADEPERRPDTGELPADEHNAPADEFDAGQRLLDTAAHRRAVRAELAACCGALRHLAHCCVAF